MRFYTNAKQYGNNVLVRYVENGKRYQDKIQFQPTLYAKATKETGFKSLKGEYLLPRKFDDINAARDFVMKYKDVENFPIFGNTAYQFQWISDNYKGEVEYDLSLIKVASVDIETTVNHGFPNYFDPMEEITLISVRDKVSGDIKTFGCWGYTPKKKYVDYVECRDEAHLLATFVNWWSKNYPDIITGWNTDEFDIPYLVERIRKVVGEDVVKKLSPFGGVKFREKEVQGKIVRDYEIYGIASLDYLALFRKFAFMKFENEKLDTVAFHVLGKNKVDNPYNSFKEFYTGVFDVHDDNETHPIKKLGRERTKMKQELIKRGIFPKK